MRRAAVILLSAVAIGPRLAAADETTVTALQSTTHVELNTGVLSGPDANVVAFGVQGELKVHRNVGLTFDIPWAVGQLTGDPNPSGSAGNPSVGLLGVYQMIPRLVLWASVLETIPTIYATPDTNAGLAGMSLATLAVFASGEYEAWRFYPEFGAFRAAIGLEGAPAKALRLRFEAAVVNFFAAGVDARTTYQSAVTPVFETAVELEGHLPRNFSLGVRWQWFGDGVTATAAEAFAGYRWSRGLYVRLGLLAGVNWLVLEPYDFYSFETVRLTVGWMF